jgi:hypothetical protein
VVVHIYNPSTGEAETVGFEASLGYIARLYLKKPKEKKKQRGPILAEGQESHTVDV